MNILPGKVALMVFTKKQVIESKQVRYIFPLKGFGENHSFTIASFEKEKAQQKLTTTRFVLVGWVRRPTTTI